MTTLSANIWYSSDGQSWNYSPGSPFATNAVGTGYSVAYDGIGKWVAVGGGLGNNIYYSTNGINWTAVSGSPFGTGTGYSVAYGGGKWVAVGQDDSGSGNNIYYSSNGQNWTAVSGSPFGNSVFGGGKSVAYDGSGKWVAVGNGSGSGNNIYYSTNGQSWTAATATASGPIFGTNGFGNSVAYDGIGKWVAVGFDSSGNNIWYSSDGGVTWTAASGYPGYGNSVAYDGSGKWVAVGFDDSGSGNNIWYSSDGQSWAAAPDSPFTDGGTGNSVAFANGTWVAVGDGVYYSTNGINWIFALSFGGNSIAFANGKWVAVGYGSSGNNIYYSTNGINWTAASGFPFGNIGYQQTEPYANSVAYANGIWVAVGYGTANATPPIPPIPPIPPKPKPTYVDLSKFLLPTCPSSLRVDSIEGRLLTASILDFKEGIYYAFYVDGNKVLNNIQTSTFQYTFPFPGSHNLYITCSNIPTNNSAQKTLPKNIVSVFII